jgi:hypothetical protein
MSAPGTKRLTVAPTEGLLAEAVLKHDALCRTVAHDPKADRVGGRGQHRSRRRQVTLSIDKIAAALSLVKAGLSPTADRLDGARPGRLSS